MGLVVAAVGCGRSLPPRVASFESQRVGSQAECRPSFPDQGGWLGGDVASSAVLPGSDGRSSVWLFGDSFIASTPSPAIARRYPFAHHAIALSHCAPDGAWQIDFATERRFFEPDPRASWVAQVVSETNATPYYWPISAVAVGDALYVALLRVAPAAPRGPFALPFRLFGVDLARIADPTRPLRDWKVELATLSSRGDFLPATALVASGEHLYAFATVHVAGGGGRSPRGLARLPLAALAAWPDAAAGAGEVDDDDDADDAAYAGRAPAAFDLESKLEVLQGDGAWQSGGEVSGARLLMNDDASEMSVHFDPEQRAWLAVYSDPTRAGGGPADTVWLRRASRIEGPWSKPHALYRIPELARPDGPPAGEPFCYAAKAHPELARAGRLLVTYVCNLFATREDEVPAVLERLRATPALYRPRVVELPVPARR